MQAVVIVNCSNVIAWHYGINMMVKISRARIRNHWYM